MRVILVTQYSFSPVDHSCGGFSPVRGRARGPFLVVVFRFWLHPVSCVVRSADESPDVLLFQMTEIEIQNNHAEEYLKCLPNTLLKNMLFYDSSPFYKEPCVQAAVCRRCAAQTSPSQSHSIFQSPATDYVAVLTVSKGGYRS